MFELGKKCISNVG